MTYRAPVEDILLALNHGAALNDAIRAGHYRDYDPGTARAVIEEAGKFASEVLAPLNRVGDQHGAIGRRAVTVEYLRYNTDGTMKPVVQTEAGVSVPSP